MKKITKLFLFLATIVARRNSFKRLALAGLGVILSLSMLPAATQYCHTPISTNDGLTTIYLSCQSPSSGQYEIKIESDVVMTGLGGSYAYQNGVGGYALNEAGHFVLSPDGKTITIAIASSSPTNLYTPLYILMPGEKVFTWPTDITWGICPTGGPTDTTLPVMGSASVVGTPTYNSAVLLLAATDDVTSPVTSFVANDAANNIVNKALTADASGNVTITGLNPATTYNLVITARDAAYNVSANSKTVNFTTAVRASECTGDKGHFGNPTVLKIHYTIQYAGGNVIYTVTPIDAARTLSLVEVQTTSGNYGMTIAGDGKSATYTQTGLTAGASMGILFMYKLDNMPGNEMTAQTSSLTDPNSIYYKVGDCAITDSEAPAAFTATLGAVTSNSVELLLNATDNLNVIVYTVTYGTTPTVVTTNGVSGTQLSYVISGLTPGTAYTFSVVAKDAAGNPAPNNPIAVQATTTALLAPTVAAPTPPVYAAPKVISIFSDAYTSIPGTTNFNASWGQSSQKTDIQIGSDNILKYANFNYVGITFNHIAPAAMKYLHIDVWTPDETALRLYPICWTGTGNEPEHYKTLTPINMNQWNSYDIPLTDFTSQGLTMNDVYQLKITGSSNISGGATKNIYVDNIYFYDPTTTIDTQKPAAFTATKGAVASDAVELLLYATDDSGAVTYTITYGTGSTVVTTGGISGTQKSYTISGLSGSTDYSFSVVATDATGNVADNSPITVTATTLAPVPAAAVPSYDASKVISIYSDAYPSVMRADGWQDWSGNTFSTVSLGGNSTLKDIATCCFGTSFATATIDVSSMTHLHVDIYPVTPTTMNFGFFTAGAAAVVEKNLTLTTGQWNSINLALSDLKILYPTVDYTQVKQISFGGGAIPTAGTFYLDNLLFYNDGTTAISTVISENGISCYPNPITNKVTVSAKTEINQVIVRNLLGQAVKTTTVNGFEKAIDLSDVAAGNYFITLKLANGQLATQKIVKL